MVTWCEKYERIIEHKANQLQAVFTQLFNHGYSIKSMKTKTN